MNTNASKPQVLARLFAAGLDSIRVSLTSAREKHYSSYYRPQGYGFKDVLASIRRAKKDRARVWLNYLVMPGFTDTEEEFLAVQKLIESKQIDMIQWRNLNFDPLEYFRKLKISPEGSRMLGIREVIQRLKIRFPQLLMGYFNPSKKRIKRKLS